MLLKLIENIKQTIPVAKHNVIIKTVWVRSISNDRISAMDGGVWAALHSSFLSPLECEGIPRRKFQR
jgi:hypothetical protein